MLRRKDERALTGIGGDDKEVKGGTGRGAGKGRFLVVATSSVKKDVGNCRVAWSLVTQRWYVMCSRWLAAIFFVVAPIGCLLGLAHVLNIYLLLCFGGVRLRCCSRFEFPRFVDLPFDFLFRFIDRHLHGIVL